MNQKYAIFSKTGRFIGYGDFLPPGCLTKELPFDFNPVVQAYIGDYETGSFKNVAEIEKKELREANPDKKWVVFESYLNDTISNTIVKELGLPIYKQINLITKALYDNRDKFNLSQEFIEAYETIADIRRRHKLSIESYEELHQSGKVEFVKTIEEQAYHDKYSQSVLDLDK
jgi:hypothetical protein